MHLKAYDNEASKAKTANKLIKHFQKRCMQHIGHIVTQRALKEGMHNGFLKFLEKESNTKTHWKMDLQTDSYVVVYDNLRHAFVTVMNYDEYIANKIPELKFSRQCDIILFKHLPEDVVVDMLGYALIESRKMKKEI